jgi:predicted ATPase
VAALTLLAMASLVQGDEAAAVQQNADALQTAEALKRPFDQAYAHCWAALFENLRGDPARAAHHAGQAIGISQRHGFAGWLAASAMQLGKAKAALGEAHEAIGLIGNTLPAWQGSGAETMSSYFLSGLADGHRAAGQGEQALQALAQALDHAERHGEHWYDAELLRLRGELLAQREDLRAQAEAEFQRAIEIARRQGARLFELRAAISLARMPDHGDAAKAARALLQRALSGYPAAQDSPERQQAVALLDELPA